MVRLSRWVTVVMGKCPLGICRDGKLSSGKLSFRKLNGKLSSGKLSAHLGSSIPHYGGPRWKQLGTLNFWNLDADLNLDDFIWLRLTGCMQVF